MKEMIDKILKGNVIESLFDNFEEKIKYRKGILKRKHRQLIGQKRRLQYYKRLKKTIFEPVIATYKEPVGLESKESNIIWFCWLQGIENAPPIVQAAYASIQREFCSNGAWQIIVITEKNMFDYVSLPEYILQKYNKGIINKTKLSNMIRLELLIKYGGLWIDSTVYVTGHTMLERIKHSDLCMPSKWIFFSGEIMSHDNWFIYSKSNNKLLLLIRELHFAYWKKYDYLIDYFIFHIFFAMVQEYYRDESKKMPYLCVHTCEYLSNILFEQYNQEQFEMIKNQTDFHKLSYKYAKENFEKQGTYYKQILEIESL
jgi:hypothetical protein